MTYEDAKAVMRPKTLQNLSHPPLLKTQENILMHDENP